MLHSKASRFAIAILAAVCATALTPAFALKCDLREFLDRAFVCKSYQNQRVVNIKVETSTSMMYVNGEDGSRDAYRITECASTLVDVKDEFGLHTKYVPELHDIKVGEREFLGYDENSGYWAYIEHIWYENLTNIRQMRSSNYYRCIPSQ